MDKQTVTINGTVYDAHTGLPISGSETEATPQTVKPSAAPQVHPSQAVHTNVQKSQTLNRRIVQKTNAAASEQPHQTVTKSPAITKFAPHPAGIKPVTRKFSDIGPVAHPVVNKVHQQIQQQTAAKETGAQAPKPSQVIKQEAIAEAMEKAPSRSHKDKPVKRTKKLQRFVSIGSVSLALLLLGGYFTYLNLPSLSVRVAAASAGIDASYPEYHPDGYSLSGAVAYSEGQVSMKFASNTGPHNYTINQSKSNWDSSAVGNDVDKKTDGKYITYNERGLTIYTYGSNASWVNGGILYTINGDAPLSSDQIRRIATSL